MNALGRSRRGAVYVEFIIAIMPMLLLFWGIMQLNGLLMAELVVQHAATNAVRAAVVCDSDEKTKGESGAMDCADKAAKMTTAAVKSIEGTTVAIRGASESGNDPVTATVTASYHCQVPLVAPFVCGGVGGGGTTATIKRSATLPNQGHYYKF